MKPVRLVVDTNVIVWAHLRPDGLERSVLNIALSPLVKLYVSPAVLDEYRDVLRRPKLRLPARLVEESLQMIEARAECVAPRRPIANPADPDDSAFLECAAAARAHYLVTGNLRHFPSALRGTRIVNSREFLQRWFEAPE